MSVFVRREVRSLAADDPTLPAYAKAVATMRGRDDDDPTSWSYQAGMHGRAPELPQEALFNGCQHGSWFFVCWHRMYLYYFERIVRAAVIASEGPEDWALPYWNYGLNGDFASLPDAFRQPATDDNPLFVAQRLQAMNQGGIMPPSVTSASAALAAPRFVGTTQFGGGQAGPGFFLTVPGLLERQPHNAVHGVVGGGNGWMNDPTTAAQDPIFWLHHANVDRLWSVWSAEHANPADPNWLNEKFDFFDADGQQVTMTAADVLDTVAQLDYTYDPAPAPKRPLLESITPTMTPAPSDADHEPDLIGRTTEPIQLTGAPTRIEVPVDAQARRAVLESLPVDQPTRTILNLDNIEAKASPGTVYGVYVNLPDEAPVDLEPVHQVGTLSFFGIERVESPTGDEHAHSLRYSYDITDLVAALERRGQWDESKMYVTLRPLTVLPPAGAVGEEALATPQRTPAADPPVTIGQISIGHL